MVVVIVINDPVGVGDVGVVCHGEEDEGGQQDGGVEGRFFMREEGASSYRTIWQEWFLCVVFFCCFWRENGF